MVFFYIKPYRHAQYIEETLARYGKSPFRMTKESFGSGYAGILIPQNIAWKSNMDRIIEDKFLFYLINF